MSEFALIERIRQRAAVRADVVLGIGDDAALLQPSAGEQLVVTTDTLNAGVHFPDETLPADLGWKALAVNLSDLAAMGARARWCTLAMSLPRVDEAWLDGFTEGFFALADVHDVVLVGGDTTHGPLSITVTAFGEVPAGSALRRDGARSGDDIWVTGAPGEAAAALALWQRGELDVTLPSDDVRDEHLRHRLLRPLPRLDAGRRLVGLASACADVSDGLLADLGHICARSGLGARLEMAALPCSPVLAARFDDGQALPWIAAGGDDYELCFTAAPNLRDDVLRAMEFAGVSVTRIGRMVLGGDVVVLDPQGRPWQSGRAGYEHFSG